MLFVVEELAMLETANGSINGSRVADVAILRKRHNSNSPKGNMTLI